MKLIIKSIKQVVYEIDDIEPSDTIEALKKKIESVHGFDSSSIKLVFSGSILSDNTKTLESYNIQENNVLIMTTSKIKPKINPNPEPVKEDEIPKETGKPTTTTTTTTKTETKPVTNIEPKKEEVNYDKEIGNLMDMGFPKDESTAAIKAARGNLELAIEFLYNGIPENLPDLFDNSASSSSNPTTALLKFLSSIIKVSIQGDESKLELILADLKNKNPEMFDLISQNQEQFKNLISQPLNEEDIKVFTDFQRGAIPGLGMGSGSGAGIGRSGSGSGGDVRQTGDGRIAVSKEDFESIKKLKAFGFNELEAAQAFFACEKNFEMALNFLLDGKVAENVDDDMMIDYSQFTDVNPEQFAAQSGQSGQGQIQSGQSSEKPAENVEKQPDKQEKPNQEEKESNEKEKEAENPENKSNEPENK